ncbi:MAG: hypothetical protein ACRBDX_06070 [Gammaproteobacteria bacterium]
MALNTEQFRDYLEGEYPIDVMSIFINRTGIRIQYREKQGDEQIDRQLRKAHLHDSAESFIKKAAYMDAHLERNSEMMMQLGIGDVDIAIQRVSSKPQASTSNEYRLRQDTVRSSNNQYLFATQFYPFSCKDEADITAQALREHVCSEDEKKYILEVQRLGATEHYSSTARFHTAESYSTIMGLETLG